MRSFLASLGIDYDALTKEQFVTLIDILKLSKHMKSPISQREKARSRQPHGKGKKWKYEKKRSYPAHTGGYDLLRGFAQSSIWLCSWEFLQYSSMPPFITRSAYSSGLL